MLQKKLKNAQQVGGGVKLENLDGRGTSPESSIPPIDQEDIKVQYSKHLSKYLIDFCPSTDSLWQGHTIICSNKESKVGGHDW